MEWLVAVIAIVVALIVAYFDEPSKEQTDRKVRKMRKEDTLSSNIDCAGTNGITFSDDGRQMWTDRNDSTTGESYNVRFDLSVGKNCNVKEDDIKPLIRVIGTYLYVDNGKVALDNTNAQTILTKTYNLTPNNGGIRLFKK